jgi:hypothetical protein
MKKRLRMILVRILTTILRLHRAPLAVKQCFALTVIALCITEVPSLLNDVFPHWAQQERKDWFLLPGFELKNPYQLVWLLKFSSEDIQKCLLVAMLAKVSKHFSIHLFLMFVILLAFCMIDASMLWINFKTWHLIYFDMVITAILLMRWIFKDYKPETIARIKSLF